MTAPDGFADPISDDENITSLVSGYSLIYSRISVERMGKRE
jgi:hypothetical protein